MDAKLKIPCLGGASFLALIAVSPAQAAPAYLDCKYDRGDGVMAEFAIATDEVGQQVIVTNKRNGRSSRFAAVFSASAVKWSEALGSGSASVLNELSRVDLIYRTKTVTFKGEIIQDAVGICTLQVEPNRAF